MIQLHLQSFSEVAELKLVSLMAQVHSISDQMKQADVSVRNALHVSMHFIFCKAQQSVAVQQNHFLCCCSLWLMIKGIWPLCSSYSYSCETGIHGWIISCS